MHHLFVYLYNNYSKSYKGEEGEASKIYHPRSHRTYRWRRHYRVVVVVAVSPNRYYCQMMDPIFHPAGIELSTPYCLRNYFFLSK